MMSTMIGSDKVNVFFWYLLTSVEFGKGPVSGLLLL